MKKNQRNIILRALAALLIPAGFALASCTAEPDDSNLYVFNGETIEDFIENNDSAFSSFHYILTKAGYDRILSSYGTYTCFVPTNEAVAMYLDSLYNDTECMIPHNGMTANSLEGMSDSLCRDISMFHLSGKVVLTTNMSAAGSDIVTLLGRLINTSIVDGKNVLNEQATITMWDYEVVNGVVHVVDHVIPRSNRLVASELEKAGDYAIFNRALVLTGLADSLMETEKKQSFTAPEPESGYYIPTTCKIQYTIFAETDETFRKNGIESIDDLIEKCKEWYGKAATGPKSSTQGWYDYYRNTNKVISTGTDYTSELNVLNMFVRYHLLKYGVSKNALVFDYCVYEQSGWNGDAFEYFETMLPKTLMKSWKVKSWLGQPVNKIFLNRYVTNNTLTDGIETIGSTGPGTMHELVNEGIEVDVDNVLNPLNGYIYPLKDILVYNAQVPNGVLHERMRFDIITTLGETMSNGFRAVHMSDVQAMTGVSAARIRFPIDYLDNVHVYNGNKTKIDMNLVADVGANSYLLYKGDSFQGMGVYDLAIKLPPVPDGMYELRVAATNFGTTNGSMLQFYLGTSTELSSMEAIDIPIDLRLGTTSSDERVAATGYVEINDQENYPDAYQDRGVESDKVMRTHGYMRDGLSIVKEYHSDGSYKPAAFNGRYVAYQFRKILVKRDFQQRDYWLRMKTVMPEETVRKYQLDYVELVPVSVYENGLYMEDMY